MVTDVALYLKLYESLYRILILEFGYIDQFLALRKFTFVPLINTISWLRWGKYIEPTLYDFFTFSRLNRNVHLPQS